MTIETYNLTCGSDSVPKSMIFEQMVIRAQKTVEHYIGDLYHDALWMQKGVPNKLEPGESFVFTWAVRDYGTAIGESLSPSELAEHKDAWKVTITYDLAYRMILTFESL